MSALAINVTVPEELRWTDTRRGEEFLLSTLDVRRLRDARLAAKAYGRPAASGRAVDGAPRSRLNHGVDTGQV